jgi:hypothetical protein
LAVVSHAIRRMQNGDDWPYLSVQLFQQILESNNLPKPAEQADNLLRWLGEQADWREATVIAGTERLQAIIGGISVNMVGYIANELLNRGFIWFDRTDTAKAISPLKMGMKFAGWQEYERLQAESTDSKTVFMAMQFNDEELNAVVETIFRPAVEATGFELRVLSDVPKAGLIDDRLRVEIRRSRFLIADLTHRNPGAYWEAGFGEGLGKEVIYTCNHLHL